MITIKNYTSISFSTLKSSATSIGLDICPFMPASLDFRLSSSKALAYLGQHFGDAVAGIEVIIYHQGLQPLQFLDLLHTVMLGLEPQRQMDHELGTFALLGMYLDGVAHHVHNVLEIAISRPVP